MFKVLFVSLFLAACGVQEKNSQEFKSNSAPVEVVFKIKAGTGENAWNTKETMVVAKVGDTVKIVNEDTIDHQLHTNGKPCSHGTNMAAGTGFYVCKATKAYDPDVDGAIYDHHVGDTARFWLKVVP